MEKVNSMSNSVNLISILALEAHSFSTLQRDFLITYQPAFLFCYSYISNAEMQSL